MNAKTVIIFCFFFLLLFHSAKGYGASSAGDGAKVIYESEIPIRRKLAKSLVARIAIPSGTIITDEMITTKGPGTGIPANRIREIPGSAAARDIATDEVIREEDIHPAV